MASPGTNLFANKTPNVQWALTDELGNAILAKGTVANIPTGAGYAVGCEYIATDTGQTYVNTGTAAAAVFTLSSGGSSEHPSKAAINATATATAAQVATGHITSTSAAATTITLPTGTDLGAALKATKGTTLDLYIDNTAGANTVTIAVATNGILSAAAAAVGASFGLLTVPSGVTGLACFRIMFSSATAYVFTRMS